MPEEGLRLLPHDEILSYEEIYQVVSTAVDMGIGKIRITGGEPLVRKGIADLVTMISGIKGITDFSMSTNGILLEEFAASLKEAGLQRINVSLDTMDPDRYRAITRGGDLERVLRGIEAAKKAGLFPIKLNCVIRKTSGEIDALGVARFATERGFPVRFIRQMDLSRGQYGIVEGGTGGNCRICNRLRLTSNGHIKPCLLNDAAFNVRELGIREAISEAIREKPEAGLFSLDNSFYHIGG